MAETIAAVVGALVTVILTKWLESGSRLWMGGDRRRSVNGRWRGTLQQIGSQLSDVQAHTLDMSLDPQWRTIKGTAFFIASIGGKDITVDLRIRGGFLYERFLKIDYFHSDSAHMQFGTAVLVLSDDGRTLSGRYVGYGSLTKQIVTGLIELAKQ
jgi:hypothetical protein